MRFLGARRACGPCRRSSPRTRPRSTRSRPSSPTSATLTRSRRRATRSSRWRSASTRRPGYDKQKARSCQDLDVKAGSQGHPRRSSSAAASSSRTSSSPKTFGSMKRIGLAADHRLLHRLRRRTRRTPRSAVKQRSRRSRGAIDKNNAGDIDKLFAIAKDDNTPDEVRDQAFARLGELPKELIVPKLYTLFEPKKWKVRWVAGTEDPEDDEHQGRARLPQAPADDGGDEDGDDRADHRTAASS